MGSNAGEDKGPVHSPNKEVIVWWIAQLVCLFFFFFSRRAAGLSPIENHASHALTTRFYGLQWNIEVRVLLMFMRLFEFA